MRSKTAPGGRCPRALALRETTRTAPLAPVLPEIRWLQPIPDALIRPGPADPAAVAVTRESVRLALIAALQYLPGRQRAVLILRDVLGWHAAEVADLLGITPTAANSLLQRARERLRQAAPGTDEVREPGEASQRALLAAYAEAFSNADVGALTKLLREDAVLEMPPQPTWFAGQEQVGRFLASRVLTEPGRFAMTGIAANGQPALAAYLRGDDGVHRAHAIQVLSFTEAGIGRIVSFNDAACSPCSACRAPLSRVAVTLPGQERDQSLDQAAGDGLVQREPQRALARQVGREFGREGGIRVGHRVQGDVVLPRRELHQALAVECDGRNLVADRLASLRHDAENPAPHLPQDGRGIFWK